MIRDMPTIETQKHGTWINDDEQGKYICSSCGKGTWRGCGMFDCCPKCGSKNGRIDPIVDYIKNGGSDNEK